MFNTKVDNTVDNRTAESTFAFIGPLPERKPKKSKHRKKETEEGADSDLESGSDKEEGDVKEPNEANEEIESDEDDSATITLKGNQTRIPKVHAFGYLADCIECHGNHDIGSTGMYECFHRRGKRYIKHSNLNQTKTLQGQILLSSVTESAEAPDRAVQSARARVFYEEKSNGAITTNRPVIVSDDESSEDEGHKAYVHLGAGIINRASIDRALLIYENILFTYAQHIQVRTRPSQTCFEFKERVIVVAH